MKLTIFGQVIEQLFTDALDIYRYIDVSNSDGTTDKKLSKEPIESNISCRLSFFKMESVLDKAIDEVPLSATPKIFYPVSKIILQGDYIKLRRMDGSVVIGTYEGDAGMSNIYPTHKEVLFHVKGSA